MVGHVTMANYFFCSQARGEGMPTTTNYERVGDKASLVKGLNESLAYCDAVYSSTTDENFEQRIRVAGPAGEPRPRAAPR